MSEHIIQPWMINHQLQQMLTLTFFHGGIQLNWKEMREKRIDAMKRGQLCFWMSNRAHASSS